MQVQNGGDQVSGGVGISCRLATPVLNVLWKYLKFDKMARSVMMSRLGIKSDRKWVVIVYGHITECFLTFIKGELHIV